MVTISRSLKTDMYGFGFIWCLFLAFTLTAVDWGAGVTLEGLAEGFFDPGHASNHIASFVAGLITVLAITLLRRFVRSIWRELFPDRKVSR